MLTIRDAQLRALDAYAEDSFVGEMVRHLRSFAPKLSEIVSEPAMVPIVRSGIERGRRYGLTNRGPLRLFLELMCTLGNSFDTDPLYEWAAEVLADSSRQSDLVRAGRLHERLLAYLDQVAGTNHRYAIDALNRLLAWDIESARRDGWCEENIMRWLARLYPQKFEFASDSKARGIVQQAAAEAARYDLPAGDGSAVLAGLKFAMGHRICEDPFYPWIAATLEDPRTVDSERRLARLVSKLRTYGGHVLTYFGQS